jgi:two-component system, response regulator
MKFQPTHPILLVEDSPEDYFITVRAFRKSTVTNPIFHCVDGDDALDFLNRRGAYSDAAKAPRPAMILLDLNMPGTDGRAVLAEVKKNDLLKEIPVVVLTTSDDERDIQGCYQAGANSYIQKPVDMDSFVTVIHGLKNYWFEIALLPTLQ